MTILQVSIPLGKTTGYEANTQAAVVATTIIPEGNVGFSIGSAITCTRPLAFRTLEILAGEMIQDLRFKSAGAVNEQRIGFNPTTGVTTKAATSVGGDAELNCAVNLAGNAHSKSLLVKDGLDQCLEVIKEIWAVRG